MTLSPAIEKAADRRHDDATTIYQERFGVIAYIAAGHGKSNAQQNRLLDQAIALCGSPYYRLDRTCTWTAEEIEFLELFA